MREIRWRGVETERRFKTDEVRRDLRTAKSGASDGAKTRKESRIVDDIEEEVFSRAEVTCDCG
jgi:hypothetical protein